MVNSKPMICLTLQKTMYGANVIIFEGILAFAKKPLIDVSMPYEMKIKDYTCCDHFGIKDYRYQAFPNTEFSYFLTIDTRQYELLNYLLEIGGHQPLEGRYDVICNDVIFHQMVNNSKTLGFQRVV